MRRAVLLASLLALALGAAPGQDAFGKGSLLVGDDPRAPIVVSDALLCEACRGVAERVAQELARTGQRRSQLSVLPMLDQSLCLQRNFASRKFTPPKMEKGCHELMDGHAEHVEDELSRSRPPRGAAEIEKAACAPVCDGVSVNPPSVTRPGENAKEASFTRKRKGKRKRRKKRRKKKKARKEL